MDQKQSNVYIDPTALVDDSVHLERGTKIWRNSHVMEGVVIGKNCIIGENVFIGKGVVVGDGCKIQNGAQVFEGVTLDPDVFIGPHVVFTNVYNPRAFIECKSEFRTTIVKRGATIGANATIVCGHNIGRYAFVAAGAVVVEDVLDFTKVIGVPARPRGWVCKCAAGLSFPLDKSIARCAVCGEEYVWKDGFVSEWVGKHE